MGKWVAGIYFYDCPDCPSGHSYAAGEPCVRCRIRESSYRQEARVRRSGWPELVMWAATATILLSGAAAVAAAYMPEWFN